MSASRLPPPSGVLAVGVLLTMLVALSYVRFVLLPSQVRPEPLEFDWRNPMLDAVPGEMVLQGREDDPTQELCIVVRPEGVVTRTHTGPERIGMLGQLRHSPGYLACSVRDVDRRRGGCGGVEAERDVVLYGLNGFGMAIDTNVVVQTLMPQRVRWGERTVVVYTATFQRYGLQAAAWSTWLTNEAPVTGAVRTEAVQGTRTDRSVFREVLPGE
jgi:hypothetical protein